MALVEIYYRGRGTAPWLLFSRQGAKGQGRRYAACLALDALWPACYLPSQQLLLHRLQMLHAHVLLAASLKRIMSGSSLESVGRKEAKL